MPSGIILVFGDCEEAHAKGNYQHAASLARDFSDELARQGLSPKIQVVLSTSLDAMHKYHEMFPPAEKDGYLNIMGTPIRTQALEELQDSDERVLAFIDANHCRGPMQGVLEHVLSPTSKVLAIYGPHQPDLGLLTTAQTYRDSFNPTRTGYGIYDYYRHDMTFKSMGFGGARLGVEVSPISEIPRPEDMEPSKYQPYASGDFQFLYMSASFGNLEALLKQYITLSKTNNFVFVGNYPEEFRKTIIRLPYAVQYYRDNGSFGENTKAGRPLSFHLFKSVPSAVMRHLMHDAQTFIAVTGSSSLLEALSSGKLPYYQDSALNEILTSSLILALSRHINASGEDPSLCFRANRLMSLLFMKKPLGPFEERRVNELLSKPDVVELASRMSKKTINDANGSVARQLLPSILAKGNPHALEQANLACSHLRKPGEMINPVYIKALRRAAFWGKEFELKVLLAHAGTIGLNICEGDAKSRSPLHWAILGKQVKAATHIIDAGASLSSCDTDGFTPLHYALTQELSVIIELLVDQGETVLLRTSEEEETIYHFPSLVAGYSDTAKQCLAKCTTIEPRSHEIDEKDRHPGGIG